jgi:hypothetical protein
VRILFTHQNFPGQYKNLLRHLASQYRCLLIGLAMSWPAWADATRHIEVTREVLLESGIAVRPHAVTRTKDGGYVIAGGITDYIPWATRTDADGNVQWRYTIDEDGKKKHIPGVGRTEYRGVATFADDSSLLCGYKDIGKQSQPLFVGMLTHIDKAGRVLSHQLIYPNGDQGHRLNYLDGCSSWGDGVAVVGHSTRFSGNAVPRRNEDFYWVLALDPKGKIKWEKVIPGGAPGQLMSGGIPEQVMVMSNQELLFTAGSGEWTVIDRAGSITAQRVVGGTLVRSVTVEPVLRVLKSVPGVTLLTLGKGLEEDEKISGNTKAISTNAAYVATDHSLVLFGQETDETNTSRSSIAWFSPDLKESEVLVFRRGASFWIDDAVPSGKTDEFVAVRQALSAGTDEKRLGVILAFVQVRKKPFANGE